VLKGHVTLETLAGAFGISRSSLQSGLARVRRTAQRIGRPSIPTDEWCSHIFGMIEDAFRAQEPMTYADIIETVEHEFGKDISLDKLQYVIRRTEGMKSIRCRAMEHRPVH
jgi:hypothetical protein